MTMNIDGTAGVTFNDASVQATALTTGTQTIAGAKTFSTAPTFSAPPVNPVNVMFSAYGNAGQSLPSGAVTKILFQTEEFDIGGGFNNTAGTVGTAPAYSFNPQIAGYYHIIASCNSNNTTGYSAAYIYKNGAGVKLGPLIPGTASSAGMYMTALLFLNGSTDYVEVQCYSSAAATTNAGPDRTFFQGFLVARSS